MLTVDQQRVNDLLRETITLLCKNGLHFKREFQIDGLIGITLDKTDVFLIKLKETVHLGDVFVRDKSRNSCRRSEGRSMHRRAHHEATRSRKNLTPIRVEPTVKYLRPHATEAASITDVKSIPKTTTTENCEGETEKNEEGEAAGSSEEVGKEVKEGSQEGGEEEMANEGPTEETNKSMEEEESFKDAPFDSNDEFKQDAEYDEDSYRGNDDDKCNSSASSLQYMSPRVQEEEPVVVKIEPPDNFINNNNNNMSFNNPFNHWNMPHNKNFNNNNYNINNKNILNDNNNNNTMIRQQMLPSHSNTTSPYRNQGSNNNNYSHNNNTSSFSQPPFNNNNSNNNNSSSNLFSNDNKRGSMTDLYSSLVDPVPPFPSSDDFSSMTSGDFMHMTQQQFSQQQQLNRLLQRRQRSTFTKSQVKRLEDVFKSIHYVDAGLRMKLSKELSLSEGTINIWFQNRRQKLKKQQQLHQQIMSLSGGAPSDDYFGDIPNLSDVASPVRNNPQLNSHHPPPSNNNPNNANNNNNPPSLNSSQGLNNTPLNNNTLNNPPLNNPPLNNPPAYIQSPLNNSSSNNNIFPPPPPGPRTSNKPFDISIFDDHNKT